jgi:hypothetical protein
VDRRPTDVLGWVGGYPAVDVGEPVEAADRGEPTVDGRGGETLLLHGRPVELDVGTLGVEHRQMGVGGPLENVRRS